MKPEVHFNLIERLCLASRCVDEEDEIGMHERANVEGIVLSGSKSGFEINRPGGQVNAGLGRVRLVAEPLKILAGDETARICGRPKVLGVKAV